MNDSQSLLHNILEMDRRTKFLKIKLLKLVEENIRKYMARIGRDFSDHGKELIIKGSELEDSIKNMKR